MKVEKALMQAEDMIETGGKQTGNFGFIYPFTNEIISQLFLQNEIEGKDCLSVQASSDQALDMYLYGAKSITTFDLNPLTEYYFHLKKGAIMAGFTWAEYISFFAYIPFWGNESTKMFDEAMFQRIVPFLDENTRNFWSYLFSKYTGPKVRKSKLFTIETEDTPFLSRAIHYLNPKNYRKLQSIIHGLDLNFMCLNIDQLPDHLNENYDFMYFSNIIQYVHLLYENPNLKEQTLSQKEQLEKYRQLMEEISNYLNPGGTMIVGNVWISSFRKIWNTGVFTLEKGYSYRKHDAKVNPPHMEKTGAAIIYKKR